VFVLESRSMDDAQPAIPMLSYEDVGTAVDWLVEAFGFQEDGPRYADDDGRVTHAELSLGGATVFLGWPGEDYRSPDHHAEVCEVAHRMSEVPFVVNGVHITVEDARAHCERARAAGARIIREPEELPFGTLYSVADIEGQRWMFMQKPR
jgi:PhnB protein